MSNWKTLHSFYASDTWYSFKTNLMITRGMVCQYCNKEILSRYECIPHHIKELTLLNVNDYAISLNEDNIMLVHLSCHNKLHDRYGGYKQKKVYLVHGAPLSGKSTLVNNSAGKGDLILDIDNLWDAICIGGSQHKPDSIRQIAFKLYDTMLDAIRMRHGRWYVAWVIGTFPLLGERERMVLLLGAELIHVECSIDECLNRCGKDEQHRKYVHDYFERYQPWYTNDYISKH